MIRIYRGDDTGGAFGRKIYITINTPTGVSLDGCHAEFIFDGICKTIEAPIVAGERREIFFSHNETNSMPLGMGAASFRVIDAAGKIRTVDNKIPVEVTPILSKVYPGTSEITVTISSGFNIAWADITGKPSTFPPSAHSHAWNDVTDKPSTFPPSEHTHAAIAEKVAKASFSRFNDISTGTGTQREIKVAVEALITKLQSLQTAAIAVVASFIICSAFADVTRSTEWQDVPPTTTIGSVVDLGTPGDYYNVSNKSYSAVQYTNGYIDAVNGYKIGEDARITFTNEYMTFYANGAMALRLSNATSYLNGDLAMLDGSGGVLFITDFYNDRYNIISNTVTKSYVESLGIEAGISAATATNIAEAVAESVVDGKVTTGYTWSTPDEWAIDVELGRSVTPSGAIEVKWESMRQMSNVVATITYGQFADCTPVLVDESSMNPPSIVQWSSAPSGGTITADGHFTCTNDGIYRIYARASSGVVRYADIPINANRAESDVVWSQYIADTNGSVRKAVNDAALATLNSATFVSSNKYEETWYALYNTFVPRMTRTGAGNIAHLAISEHIVASAWHYWPWGLRTGTDTWDDGAGNTSTTTRREWVRLADWAATNGWTEAQIKEMDIADIAVCRCDKSTSIPDGCRPKFMRDSTSKAWFGDTLDGVMAWYFGQSHNYAIPCRLSIWNHAPNVISWTQSVPNYGSETCRIDAIPRLQEMGQQYPAHAGDSGKPVFIMKDGSPIIVSTFYGIGVGPNYIKGFEVLKAFVEAYGDTLKEAN